MAKSSSMSKDISMTCAVLDPGGDGGGGDGGGAGGGDGGGGEGGGGEGGGGEGGGGEGGACCMNSFTYVR